MEDILLKSTSPVSSHKNRKWTSFWITTIHIKSLPFWTQILSANPLVVFFWLMAFCMRNNVWCTINFLASWQKTNQESNLTDNVLNPGPASNLFKKQSLRKLKTHICKKNRFNMIQTSLYLVKVMDVLRGISGQCRCWSSQVLKWCLHIGSLCTLCSPYSVCTLETSTSRAVNFQFGPPLTSRARRHCQGLCASK